MTTRLGLYGGARQPNGSFTGKTLAGASRDKITRLGLYGGTRQLQGPYTGKALDGDVLKPKITKLGLYGGTRQLQGSYTGKVLDGTPVARPTITRLGLYGGTRGLYGTFAGKAESDVTLGGRRRHRFYLDDLEVDYEFGLDTKLDSSLLNELSIPLESPIKADAVAINSIDDPIDRELALLVRRQVVEEHGKLQQSRLEQLQLLDMELYFMVLALIDEGF